ncbi:hypothetical protein KW803_00295 [Candidatus Saccharibacteria bacterium]|nr:hypothetical protein [Candidatus Saccharibacteria bacterium]
MKYSINQKRTIILELLYSIIMIVIGTVLPTIFYKSNPDENKATIYGLEVIAAVGLGLQFYTYLTKGKRRILRIYLLAALISLLILLFGVA